MIRIPVRLPASGFRGDGDSFVLARRDTGEEFSCRIYSYDCPETTNKGRGMRERVGDQARAWRVSHAETLRLGIRAEAFTAWWLMSAWGLHVLTRGQDGLGASRGGRVLCQVRRFAWFGLAGTGDLGEDLYRAGLARKHGFKA